MIVKDYVQRNQVFTLKDFCLGQASKPGTVRSLGQLSPVEMPYYTRTSRLPLGATWATEANEEPNVFYCKTGGKEWTYTHIP